MPVDSSLVDGVAVITLDRQESLNSFDDELGTEFLELIEAASADVAVRCIVITGAGRAFSAGEDLSALQSTYERGEAPPLGDTLVRRYNPTIQAITSAPKPVIAAVNGVAAGAGASIALACDHRVASEKARLVLAFIEAGLVADSGAIWFLARMIGTARALHYATTAESIDAETGRSLGLFDEVVAVEGFERAWRDAASRLAAGPTAAYAIAKELVYSALDRSLAEQLEIEVDAQTRAGRTADHLEGVRAFLEKRRPEFRGR
ncbi:MAG: hypothetical protein GEU78_09455 [Actinobacteria bacterium]|nr:hypothetical protein [Actinomycetota bacterium]